MKTYLFLLPQSILIDTQIILFCTTLVETAIYHQLCKMNTLASVKQIFGNKRFDGWHVWGNNSHNNHIGSYHSICSLSAKAFSYRCEIWGELGAVMSKNHGIPLKYMVLSKAFNLFRFTESRVIVSARVIIVEVIHQWGRGLIQPFGQTVAVDCTVLQLNKDKFAPVGCSHGLIVALGHQLHGPAQNLEEPHPSCLFHGLPGMPWQLSVSISLHTSRENNTGK